MPTHRTQEAEVPTVPAVLQPCERRAEVNQEVGRGLTSNRMQRHLRLLTVASTAAPIQLPMVPPRRAKSERGNRERHKLPLMVLEGPHRPVFT